MGTDTSPHVAPVDVCTTRKFSQVKEPLQQAGLQPKDELAAFNGQPVDVGNIVAIAGQMQGLKAGDAYTLTVRREGKEVEVPVKVLQKEEVKQFAFEPDPRATPAQLQLREAWAKNL